MKKKYKKIFFSFSTVILPSFFVISCEKNQLNDENLFNEKIDFSKIIGKNNSIIINENVNLEKEKTKIETEEKENEKEINKDNNTSNNVPGNEINDKKEDAIEKNDADSSSSVNNSTLVLDNAQLFFDDDLESFSLEVRTNKENLDFREAQKFYFTYKLYNVEGSEEEIIRKPSSFDSDKSSKLILFIENEKNFKKLKIQSVEYLKDQLDISNINQELSFPNKEPKETIDGEMNSGNHSEGDESLDSNTSTTGEDSDAILSVSSISVEVDELLQNEATLSLRLNKEIEKESAQNIKIKLKKYINTTETEEVEIEYTINHPIKTNKTNLVSADLFDLEYNTKYEISSIKYDSNFITFPSSNAIFQTGAEE
ncbi:hypothetical protein [Mesomycoplasma molare]|uniref:Lipoprotein n=1 Tax=Mesomycoplasma molare TaxID=171288 RepID=A0ABY5TV77_9BACT|nr:hypothetical protein [Mesomycoplasma molare]UWD34573.1 hypothetical protein NX772_01960 [Mesomycoplasma molare]